MHSPQDIIAQIKPQKMLPLFYHADADVLSILLAFYWPSLWFMPILLQLGSGGAIAVFLFNADSAFTIYGFLMG